MSTPPIVRRPRRLDEPTALDLVAIFVELGGVTWFVLRRRMCRKLARRSEETSRVRLR